MKVVSNTAEKLLTRLKFADKCVKGASLTDLSRSFEVTGSRSFDPGETQIQ